MNVAVARRNEMLNALIDNLNSGILRVYSGTQPANADAALSGNTLLAELTFGATAYANASGGSAASNAITGDTSANATGTASFARLFESNGTTVVGDISVSATGGGGELQFATTSFVAGMAINVTSLTLTL